MDYFRSLKASIELIHSFVVFGGGGGGGGGGAAAAAAAARLLFLLFSLCLFVSPSEFASRTD